MVFTFFITYINSHEGCISLSASSYKEFPMVDTVLSLMGS